MTELYAVSEDGHVFWVRAYFEFDHPDVGWYRARFGCGGFTSRPSDSNYGSANPRMWTYGHAVVGENFSAGPSFHAGSRRA